MKALAPRARASAMAAAGAIAQQSIMRPHRVLANTEIFAPDQGGGR